MSKIVYTRETTNDDIGTVETFYEAQADELSGETLEPYFDSSESVTKSLNESGNIEFNVNADIVQKVERAILTPVDTPTEDVVPVVDSTNAVSYKPLSEIGGGGGGGIQTITFTSRGDLYNWLLNNSSKVIRFHIDVQNVYEFNFLNMGKYGDGTDDDPYFFQASYTFFSYRGDTQVVGQDIHITNTGVEVGVDGSIQWTPDGTITTTYGDRIPIPDEYWSIVTCVITYLE